MEWRKAFENCHVCTKERKKEEKFGYFTTNSIFPSTTNWKEVRCDTKRQGIVFWICTKSWLA
jgi:hypothetical protein